jgi:hypothetical protein
VQFDIPIIDNVVSAAICFHSTAWKPDSGRGNNTPSSTFEQSWVEMVKIGVLNSQSVGIWFLG